MMTNHDGRWTARELLAYVAGEEHADHSIASKAAPSKGMVQFQCTCGAMCIVVAVNRYTDALRNVMERP